ncbi:MAG TPA: hypothetical protein VNJ70_05555 [Thermoanaerobaculia bacterium]|nr:hypothetical protein [Thermoanaerobaculia bacterium]
MNALRTQFPLSAASRLLTIAVSLTAAGCATTQVATLEGVIKDERRASGPEIQDVQIKRGEDTPRTRFGMALTKGDRIVTTAPDVKAVITFAGGWEVIIEPESELEILNPSIFVRIGGAIVTGLRRVRETLKAQTEYTIAAPEGTLFKIEVRGAEVTYKVVDGRLRVSSRVEDWTAVVLGPLDQGTIVGSAPPERALLDPREADEIRREVRRASALIEGAPDEPPPSPPDLEPVDDSEYYCTRAIEAFERGDLEEAASLAQRALGLYAKDRQLTGSDYRRCKEISEELAPDPDHSSKLDSKYYCAKAIEAARRKDEKGAASLAQQALGLHKQDGRLSKSEYATCRLLAGSRQ